MIGTGAFITIALRSSDVIYSPLPMYHLSTGLMAAGVTIIYGNTLVIKKKFSASHFWTDCCKYKATVCPYLGS